MKDFFAGFVAGVVEGMRDGLQLILALIAAPFLVCIEFATRTGRWKPRQDDARAD
jgi:hypothetical protein